MEKYNSEDLTFEPLSSPLHRLLQSVREKMTDNKKVERIAAALEIASPYHDCLVSPDLW